MCKPDTMLFTHLPGVNGPKWDEITLKTFNRDHKEQTN